MEEIVHIIPLASEIDMAVKPFDKMRLIKSTSCIPNT